MRHSAPLQRKDGRWVYTTSRCPTGYCTPYEPPTHKVASMFSEDPDGFIAESIAQEKPFLGNYHDDGHATEEEACECYKRYMLDHKLRLGQKYENQMFRCRVCKEFTQGYAGVGPWTMFSLCDAHNNREEVEKLYRVGESWES